MSQDSGASPAHTLTLQQQRRGMRLVYLGQSAAPMILLLLHITAFGALFIKHLGGSNLQALLLGPLISLSRVLTVPTSLLVSPGAGKRFMIRCWMLTGLTMTAMLGATFLPVDKELKIWIVLLLIGLGGAVHATGGTFWFPLLHDLVPPQQRGRFFGRMRTHWRASLLGATLLAGWFLGKAPELWRFQVVIAVAVMLYLTRTYIFSKIPQGASPVVRSDYSDWKRYVRSILARRKVVVFCGYFSLLGLCAGFLGTPMVLYMKFKGFPVRDNIWVFGSALLGHVAALLTAGVLVDRAGTKKVFLACHVVLWAVCFAVVGIGWLPEGQVKLCLPAALVTAGAMRSAAMVACTVQMFHLAPDRGRAFFMSLSWVLIGAGAGLAPLLAGAILDYAPEGWTAAFGGLPFDVFQVMLAAAGIGMLAVMPLLLAVEDVRPREALEDASEPK